jgi:ubiquinone/menaquinone biosynthesis C-methylase UbiE
VHDMAKDGFREDTIGKYEAGRPDYNLVQLQAAISTGLPSEALSKKQLVVADIGSGTGKSLRSVNEALKKVVADSGTGLELHAVEPTPLGAALAASVPDLDPECIHAADATSLPFSDGSVDVVSIGQAFHWFATEESVKEISRVLNPDTGILLLAWNTRNAMTTTDCDGSPESLARAKDFITSFGDAFLNGDDGAKRSAIERMGENSPLYLPCIVEAAVEHHYGPGTPRQQSGAWTKLFDMVEPGAGSEADGFSTAANRQYGPFGPFPQEAFMLGSVVLSSTERHLGPEHVKPEDFDPKNFLIKAGHVDMEAVDPTRRPGDAKWDASPFEPLRHWRQHETLKMTRKQIREAFESVSVVAAADKASKLRTTTVLDHALFAAAIKSDSGLLNVPYIRDVFVARLK